MRRPRGTIQGTCGGCCGSSSSTERVTPDSAPSLSRDPPETSGTKRLFEALKCWGRCPGHGVSLGSLVRGRALLLQDGPSNQPEGALLGRTLELCCEQCIHSPAPPGLWSLLPRRVITQIAPRVWGSWSSWAPPLLAGVICMAGSPGHLSASLSLLRAPGSEQGLSDLGPKSRPVGR